MTTKKNKNNKIKPKMGRPDKLDLLPQIAKKIENGAMPEVAAISCGMSRRTFYKYMQLGKDGHKDFTDFTDVINEAKITMRSTIEQRLYLAHPTFYARHSPMLREGKDGLEGGNNYDNKDTNIQVVTVSSIVDSASKDNAINIFDYEVKDIDKEINYVGDNGNDNKKPTDTDTEVE